MNTLFGISMDTIMAVSLGAFLAITLVVVVLALRNRLLVRLGLRNIPRRRAQTVLIVVGLMLSTVIITSAFGTGDTMSYSIRNSAVTQLGAIDEIVSSNAAAAGAISTYFPASMVGRIHASLAPGHNVDGVTGAIAQTTALQDLTTRQTKANVEMLGVPASYPAAFGALTTVGGAAASLGQLGPHDIYLNAVAQQALNAHAGDTLHLYSGGRPVSFTVRDVLRNENLAAVGLLGSSGNVPPEALLPLARLQTLIGQPAAINVVFISNNGDALAGASLSDKVATPLRASLANPAAVRAAKTVLASPQGQVALRKLRADHTIAAATQTKLRDLQTQLRAPGETATLKSLLSDKDVTGALQTIKDPAVTAPLSTALLGISDYSVYTSKQNALTSADQFGNVFSTIFIVFGLFSIAAGIMLIFLIFVMLAAERRAEMGMARAIGTKRRHLIEQFLFEGYAYDLGAALVGVALGIGVGLGMVSVIAALVGNFGFTLQPQIALRSIVVAFCVGALVTFVTVAFSSWRVSRLNIVAAIRDLPEDLHVDGSIGAAFHKSIKDLTSTRHLVRRIVFLALTVLVTFAITRNPANAVLLTVGVQVGWYAVWSFRRLWVAFTSRGPILLLAGYGLLSWGIAAKQLFPFDLGISLLLIGAAMLLRWVLGGLRVPDRVRNRLGYSLAGIALVIFWLLPFDAIRSDLHSDIEMFFLAGMMLVLGGVWTVMYNSDLLLGALLAVFGRIGSLAPALKMAVTYPLQNRVRTGLTLSMFSLVIFTLMVMSVLTGSFGSTALNLNRDIGGYQVYGSTSSLNPVRDPMAAIAAHPSLRHRVVAAGGIGQVGIGLRQPHQKNQTWQPNGLDVADNAYLDSTRYTLHARAAGYTSDAQVWQALKTHPGYAVVAGSMVKDKTNNSSRDFQLQGFYYQDKTFQPVQIEMRDMRNGAVIPLTVVGVLDRQSFFADNIYTSESTLTAAHDAPVTPTTLYFRTAPGQNVHQAALALGSAFLPNGLDTHETAVEYNKDLAVSIGLNNLLEGFMALGLVVGIAALGVVATRSVVERRQQIGMLRAIGFKRRMVQTSFLLESSFVSLVGTVLGVVLGLLLAKQLIAFFGKSDPTVHLVIPWAQVGGIVALAYVASLLTTYLPAWQASRIYPAEALRYE